MQVYTAPYRRQRLLDDVFQPRGPAVAQSACLPHDHRSVVALPRERKQITQRLNPLVVRWQRHVWTLLSELHLAERVAVDAHDVENLRGSAQLRVPLPGDRVPCIKRVLFRLMLGLVRQVGAVLRWHNQDERVDVHHSRIGIHIADRCDGFDIGLAEREPQLMPLLLRLTERRSPAPRPTHEPVERYLIDRCKEVRPLSVRLAPADARDDVLSRRTGIRGEPVREIGIERVGVIGIAIVAQIPDRHDLVTVHRLDEGIDA